MDIKTKIQQLFTQSFGSKPTEIQRLPRSGSIRQYFRIKSNGQSVIATYNPNLLENQAFVYMSNFFKQKGLNVPKIYKFFSDKHIYFQQDLGDTTLFDVLKHQTDLTEIYKDILQHLLKFQTSTQNFDWTRTYPVQRFDYQAYMFDLNYFKYLVLKLNNINFHEAILQQEFDNLVRFVLQTRSDFFVYRDFQSKNIMIHEQQFYFIDYQGGRQGNIFYDLASLLYDSKAQLDEQLRADLELYYYQISKPFHGLDFQQFDRFFYANVLIRKLQAFAAYALRGLVEHKPHFLTSIPYVIKDLTQLLKSGKIPIQFNELQNAAAQLAEKFPHGKKKLNVNLRINSFSYHFTGYPKDEAGHGGGFVFDCRSLPNPGRVDELKNLTGLDSEVKKWIEAHHEFEQFLGNAFKLVSMALENYHQRGFTELQVNFGCTGGQHRSVYCAEKLAEMLQDYYELNSLTIKHLALEQNKIAGGER